MNAMTKEIIQESIESLKDIRTYFILEEKCKCDDEDGVCQRCDYINELELAIQRIGNLTK